MEAFFYEKQDNFSVKCGLCSHNCIITHGKRGICQVRENKNGKLTSLVYGQVIAKNVDPIEKKPLFHFLPGSFSCSIATVGCNFKCRFCQNSDIAQMPSDNKGMIAGVYMSPADVVNYALSQGCMSISYTYTEPTVFFEFAYDTAKLAHKNGLLNVFVTNGYMSEQALKKIAPYLDAANVDLKSFSDDFYKKICCAKLSPVLLTLKRMKELGIFVEVTTLLIPGLNDDPDQLNQMAEFIAVELGRETPWHISRFHPAYKLKDKSITSENSLIKAYETGKKHGLFHIYLGNIPESSMENTTCCNCGKTLIYRRGFNITKNLLKENRCPFCNTDCYIFSV